MLTDRQVLNKGEKSMNKNEKAKKIAACGHEEFKNGHCNEPQCDNFIERCDFHTETKF